MSKEGYFFIKVMVLTIMFYMSFLATAESVPPVPARIGGTVTVDGRQLLRSRDRGYTFVLTKQNGTPYDPAANDKDGLNSFDWYVLDIPIYDQSEQPGGAHHGEAALIHVYRDVSELKVISPANGKITVGKSHSITRIDLVVVTSSTRSDDAVLKDDGNRHTTTSPGQKDTKVDAVESVRNEEPPKRDPGSK
jgi:hypothetical protein